MWTAQWFRLFWCPGPYKVAMCGYNLDHLGFGWRSWWMLPWLPEIDWIAKAAGIKISTLGALMKPFCCCGWCLESWTIRMDSDAGKPPVGKRRPALKNTIAIATAPNFLPKNFHLGWILNRWFPGNPLIHLLESICHHPSNPCKLTFHFDFSMLLPISKPKSIS